jgi:mannosyltransferase
VANGTGARNAEHLQDTGGLLAGLAVEAWAGRLPWLVTVTVLLAAVGAARARGVRVVGLAWALVPLVLLTVVELARPVYLPRYLMVGLRGVGVLAAAGAVAFPRALRLPVSAVLVALTLVAAQPLLERGPRERGDEVVQRLVAEQQRGEPIVAADQRSATALDHYVRLLAPELRPDVILPPDDAPADADRVWLVRRLFDGEPEPTDDDGILRDAGLHLARQEDFPASKTDLILQLWTR